MFKRPVFRRNRGWLPPIAMLFVAGVALSVFGGAASSASSPPRRAPLLVRFAVHTPPVDAPIVDPFRPPPPDQPWRPGNRGIEYDTDVGDLLRASASGTVTFAAPIGARRYVTVQHSPQLRTTYSLLAEIRVGRGEQVRRGQVIGVAGDRFHFGALLVDVYIDPTLLFGAVPLLRARLIE